MVADAEYIGLRNVQDIEDFVRGLVLMGTGGGGRPEVGRSALQSVLEEKGEVVWVPARELPDEGYTCTVLGVGTIAPFGATAASPLQKSVPRPHAAAARELADHFGYRLVAIIPGELGGANTPNAIAAACELGVPVVDGDYCGRAVPELPQMLPALKGRPILPAAVVDSWGDVAILKKSPDAAVAERLFKYFSLVTKSYDPSAICAVACCMCEAQYLKRFHVPGTLTYCLQVGRALRRAVELREDPVEVLVSRFGWYRLFEGEVTGRAWEDRDGYMMGTTYISAPNGSSLRSMRIWFKNEHHMAWIDGRTVAMSPDIIAVLRLPEGVPLTNTELAEGDHVAVVAKPHIPYRFDEGVSWLGPAHFGFAEDYRPLEELLVE